MIDPSQKKEVSIELTTLSTNNDTLLPPRLAGDGNTPSGGDCNKTISPEASSRTATSTRQFGDYELISEIARGGMGVVYKARQARLNRVVALKMILSGHLASSAEVQRFYIEAEAAAKLQHPGIIPIYDIGQRDGQHFFSMSYIEGASLADRLKEGPIAPREAAEITLKVTDAISYAHKHNVIHRDLKPANILIDSDGQPKVTDFGLAKKTEVADGLTASGQILGTPSYMPPEQASGRAGDVGPTADIYSLGAILYALLTGRAPFQAASVIDTLRQVVEQEPVPPRRLNSVIHPDLEAICLKCLCKQPDKRYSSATELHEELQRYLNGEPIHAKASSVLSRTWSTMLAETRHTEVMAMWSQVWWCHAILVIVLFCGTGLFKFAATSTIVIYAFWFVGIAAIIYAVWYFRFRKDLCLTAVEKQVGQVWGMFTVTALLTAVINHMLDLEPLKLFPIVLLECGFAFGCMATILGGSFYPVGIACFVIALFMPASPAFGIAISGLLIAIGLLIPAIKFKSRSISC